MGLQIANGRIEALEIKALGISFRRKALPGTLQSVSDSRGMSWLWPIVREACAGAWQRNEEIRTDNALSNPTLYSCITLIAGDIAKMRPRLMEFGQGIWSEIIANQPWLPLLREPNHFQTWDRFIEWWMTSKLVTGNAYILKRRDGATRVNGLYVLDPNRVKVLVAPDGSVFYELAQEDLSQAKEAVIVPAREIIHDVMCPLFHPLIGVSPIFAAGFPTLLAKHILNNARSLFANGSSPGGILTAPGHISEPDAIRLKNDFEANYSGENFGRFAVLGDGVTYTPLGMSTAVDSQLIEILRWSDEQIAKCFHMPLFKVGGPLPPYSSVEAVTQLYYSDCLQSFISKAENALRKGLELPLGMSIAFDLEDLVKMDSATTMEIATKGVSGGVLTPNEARMRFDLKPLDGGDTVYLQDQDHSIEWLKDRDENVPAVPAALPAAPEPPADTPAEDPADVEAAAEAKALEFIAQIQSTMRTEFAALQKTAETTAKDQADTGNVLQFKARLTAAASGIAAKHITSEAVNG